MEMGEVGNGGKRSLPQMSKVTKSKSRVGTIKMGLITGEQNVINSNFNINRQ